MRPCLKLKEEGQEGSSVGEHLRSMGDTLPRVPGMERGGTTFDAAILLYKISLEVYLHMYKITHTGAFQHVLTSARQKKSNCPTVGDWFKKYCNPTRWNIMQPEK